MSATKSKNFSYLKGPKGDKGDKGNPGSIVVSTAGRITYNPTTNLIGFNDAGLATQNYVDTAVNNLISGAPAVLNTLNELSAAINNNPNFVIDLTANINGKLSLAGGTMTGALILAGNPTSNLQAATKQYVDNVTGNSITSYNDLTDAPTLFSGSYNDLTNKPTLFPGDYNSLINKPALFSGAYVDLTGRPTLFSGSYTDLTNQPNIPSIAGLATETYVTTRGYLTSVDYSIITNKPTLFDGAYSSLSGRPNLSLVATSGLSGDLTWNVYPTEAGLPSATTKHGMFAHVHATGHGYMAHAGNWIKLANYSDIPAPTQTDRLVNGAYAVSLSTTGQLNLPSAANTESNNARIQSAASIDILSNLAKWTFGTDGSLTLPIGVSIDNSVSPLYPKIIADSGKLFSVQGQGSTGSAALAWTVDPTAAGQYAAVSVSRGGGDNLAKVVLQAQSDSGDVATAKTWKFDETGVLTLPADGDIKDQNGNSVLGGSSGPTDRLVNGDKQVVLQSNGYITLANGAQLYDYGSGTGNGYGITDATNGTYIGYDPSDTLGALHMDSYTGGNIRIRTTTLPNTYKDWLFSSDGVLSIPVTGDIKRNGVSVLGSGNSFSGSYTDLTDKPSIPNLATVSENILPSENVTYDLGSPTKQWKSLYLSGSTIYLGGTAIGVDNTGNFSVGGNIVINSSGSAADIDWNDISNKPTLAAVATSGSYNDLTNKPTLFSGSYTDLTNKPTIPGDINQLSDIGNLLGASNISSINWNSIDFDGGEDFEDNTPDNFDNQAFILQGEELNYPTVVGAPLTASSPGETGQIAYDNDYVYICIATNTWKRSALSSW